MLDVSTEAAETTDELPYVARVIADLVLIVEVVKPVVVMVDPPEVKVALTGYTVVDLIELSETEVPYAVRVIAEMVLIVAVVKLVLVRVDPPEV